MTIVDSRNVANNASILVYVDQSASPSGSVVSFLLPEGKDDVHPVTQHTLDGSWNNTIIISDSTNPSHSSSAPRHNVVKRWLQLNSKCASALFEITQATCPT